jgi:ATP-binding cassette subfamily B protein
MRPLNTRPDAPGGLNAVLWPAARVGEALRCLAREAGIRGRDCDVAVPREGLDSDAFAIWMRAAADQEGLQADAQLVTLSRVEDLLATAGPLLLRIALSGESQAPGFLAVSGARRGALVLIGPDHRHHRIPLAQVAGAFREPFASPVMPVIERALVDLAILPSSRARARAALVAEQLATVRAGGCWRLRVPAGAGLRGVAAESGLPRGIAILLGAHAVQSVLFVLSWWLLGRGLMLGTFDRGWLFGWLLLLLSLVPFRALTSWTQGLMATAIGAWLRRRLLRGALQIDRQSIRTDGAGRFFSVIVEAGAVESLALNGGVAAALSLIELAIAGLVLGAGSAWLLVGLLVAWLLVGAWIARRYLERRRAWTDDRLRLTHQLVENMVGHRTRIAQEPAERWHAREDDDVERYVASGQAMDGPDLALAALVPRGWLALAIAGLTPGLLSGATPSELAVAVGGALLAYRAFRRLSAGLSDVAGAIIAGQAVVPLLRAGSRRIAAGSPSAVVAPSDHHVAAEARQIAFAHRAGAEPVLQDCSLRLPRGARVLLEGASGSGKTTFASMLAGLQSPSAGTLLVGGLDRSVLGDEGWRTRVAMAPQPHDNYIVSGTLAFNLLMGRRWPARTEDLEEAEQVCRELGLGDLLDKMPAGLHQVVGETGWQLSQGERARVFLARALLQRSDLLVLDESFGALDPESVDRAVRCVLQRAPTLVAIAHA